MARQQTVHEGNAYNKDITAMTLPLFVMAFFYYGPRVLLLAIVAVVTARLADRVAALLRSRPYDSTENSSIPMALIIVLMMPATVRFRVVIASVLVAILVAKEAFGGYNSYPFNPSAVGFCVAAVSWPNEVFRYPQPTQWMLNTNLTFSQLWDLWFFKDTTLVNGPSYILKNGGIPNISGWNMVLGNYAGPLGVTALLVVIACAIFLRTRKHFSLAAPVAYLVVVSLVAFLLPRGGGIAWLSNPLEFAMGRLQIVSYELLTGALAFSAVFLVNEPGTLPKNTASRVVYGALLGFATMMFRYYGIYELGACFALLLLNAVSGYFDRALAKTAARRKKVVPQ